MTTEEAKTIVKKMAIDYRTLALTIRSQSRRDKNPEARKIDRKAQALALLSQ